MEQKIRKFIGVRAEYDKSGQMIWAVSKNDGLQQLLDLRGWGAIQNLFNAKYGTPITDTIETLISGDCLKLFVHFEYFLIISSSDCLSHFFTLSKFATLSSSCTAASPIFLTNPCL